MAANLEDEQLLALSEALDKFAARPRLAEKLLALALAWLTPVGRLERAVERRQRGLLDGLHHSDLFE